MTILRPRYQWIDFTSPDRYIIRMSLRPLQLALLILAAVAIAAAGYTAYWYSAAQQLRAGMEEWSKERRAAGWYVDLGVPDISGFPWRIDVFLQTPRLAGPDGEWRWTAPNIKAIAAPWLPGNITVSTPGIHVFTTRQGEYWVEFGDAEADISVDGSGISDTVIRLSKVDIRPPDGARMQVERAVLRGRSGVVADPAEQAPETGFGIAVDARGITLPARWRPPLGRNMARLSIDAVVTGKFGSGKTSAEMLAHWRDGGGAVEVNAFSLDWEALTLRADGTFALDAELQPEGAMMADIRGIDRTTDQLIAAGVIDARTAFAAKVANRALSFRGGSAKLPLSVQNRRLYIGPVPILRLKPVRWN